MSQIDPEILAALDEERGAMASSGRQYRSLTLKAGESALTRFLPVQMGPKKTWYARIARHWVAKRPVLCQRQTSPHFHGDPEAPCPLCDLEAEYSQSANKATAGVGAQNGGLSQNPHLPLRVRNHGRPQPQAPHSEQRTLRTQRILDCPRRVEGD